MTSVVNCDAASAPLLHTMSVCGVSLQYMHWELLGQARNNTTYSIDL